MLQHLHALVIDCAVQDFCQFVVTDRKRRDHVMDNDIRFVREFIFDRLGFVNEVAAQAVR